MREYECHGRGEDSHGANKKLLLSIMEINIGKYKI
jgi:hypothetical protein